MSGLEVPFAIAGFVVGLLLRAGREREAKLAGIAIGQRQGGHAPSVLPSTAEPALRAAEVDVVDGRAVVASDAIAIPATEDSGGEVAVPASEETRSGAAPGPELITQPRQDPAVLGRDRAKPWSW